jgi:hypothetical protein
MGDAKCRQRSGIYESCLKVDAVLLVSTRGRRNNENAREKSTVKIMNTPTVSAEAKARFAEAVKCYTPPAPEKYRALNEVKESIIALRERKASYETIRAMLHENAGIEVSHQTVARYCREVLEAGKAKKPRRAKTPTTEPPASNQTQLEAHSFTGYPRKRGPHITDSKNL